MASQLICLVRHGETLHGPVALFAHGHIFRVLVARWLGLPVAAGAHFLLDTATLSVLGYYRDIPTVKRWNAPLSPASFRRTLRKRPAAATATKERVS
jgi:broad specificity phosphatase PhoE